MCGDKCPVGSSVSQDQNSDSPHTSVIEDHLVAFGV